MSLKTFIFSITLIALSTTRISSQELTMFQSVMGFEYYQDDIKIDNKEVKKLMQTHELTKMYWNTSIKHKRIANVALGAQVIASIITLSSVSNSNGTINNTSRFFFGTSLLSGAIAIGYSITSASLKKKGIITYNKLKTGDGLLVKLAQTKNGFGFVCDF